jgi:hypothetical protein
MGQPDKKGTGISTALPTLLSTRDEGVLDPNWAGTIHFTQVTGLITQDDSVVSNSNRNSNITYTPTLARLSRSEAYGPTLYRAAGYRHTCLPGTETSTFCLAAGQLSSVRSLHIQ